MKDFKEKLGTVLGFENISENEPMSRHTTFGIGGPADYFAVPRSVEDLKAGIALCREEGMPWFITGNGSNLLVGDGGYRGLIFNICRTMDSYTIEEEEEGALVTAGAGIMLAYLARTVSKAGYAGFEYATGIPGTLGGGVTMNAGAYGGEIKDGIVWAEVMDKDGNVLKLDKEGLNLSYRHSAVMEEGYIVLKACFRFPKGDKNQIADRVNELSRSRKEKQPLEYPSAGSTFKRPEGYFAGKLIQDSNLKGFSIGGAQVSQKHSGFVINTGNATAKNVRDLIEYVQKVVFEKFGVRIEPEVRFLGEFI